MKRTLLLLLLAAAALKAPAQNKGDEFAVQAREHNTIMVAAYEKRDVTTYLAQLSKLESSYARLSARDKVKYRSVLNDAYYNLACTYALTGNKNKALAYLERSGFYDYNHLLSDDDLETLLAEPRFARFAKKAKAHSVNYVSLLRSAPAYNSREHKELPSFTYQAPEHPKLKKLADKYDLNKIGTGGTDVARMISVMRWVHDNIKHDGSKGNPDRKNALSMLKLCVGRDTSLNCRGMAIVLNELYLAMGMPSRMVTCLPKDPNDNDCHVIVSVWSDWLHKWIWMDPTFMAYVMDEKGVALGIEEVRERLVHGRPLVLNADANHNQYTHQSKEDYLYRYMAKNLYKLECPTNSEYDYETLAKGKERTYIQLLGGGGSMKKGTSSRYDGMNTYHMHYTGNPRTFWQAPPGHSQAAQHHALGEFINHYNNLDDAAINHSFSHCWDDFVAESKRPMWADGNTARLMQKYGRIRSFKYLGTDEQGVVLYKMVCEKSVHVMGFTLDGEGKFCTFRFQTSSPSINELLINSN